MNTKMNMVKRLSVSLLFLSFFCSSPSYSIPSITGASTTTSDFTDNVGGVISDNSTQSFNINVSVVGTETFDVNLTTFITHTWASDLDITLTSPSGKSVTISTDNGGSLDDVFNGTEWNDQGGLPAPTPVTDATYVNGVTTTPLQVESALSVFQGENPNGIWVLTITDDAGGDIGNISQWDLQITTLDSPLTTQSFSVLSGNVGLAINDNTLLTDNLTVIGQVGELLDVDLTTFITHTFASDLDISLLSPSGTLVVISTDNGGGNDDVFNGTVWNDQANLSPNDFVYTNGVTAATLSPEGALAAFIGENPNGDWTLRVFDDAGADQGILDSWSLNFITATASVPEPGTLLLFGLGLAGLGFARRKKA